jgi:hypothetical protein
VALGVGPLLSDGNARRTWLRLAVLCDLSDTVAAAAAARDGTFSRSASARAAAATIISGMLTITALRAQ